MAKATWNGVVLAEAPDSAVETVEGNVYFPPHSLNLEYLKESDRTSVCPWKGKARYYDLEVDGKRNTGAAWYYPNPSVAAAKLKDYVAFWKGVEVEA
jgi:uncharacterized protein (DUF427 family)